METRINLGNGLFVREEELDGFFDIYIEKGDGHPVPLRSVSPVPVEYKDLYDRLTSIKAETPASYRRALHAIFPEIPLGGSNKRIEPMKPAPAPTSAVTHKPAEIVKKINDDLETADRSAFEIFDALDSEQIIEYLESTLSPEYFYSFTRDGKTVTGISYAGTVEVAKVMCAKRVMDGKGGIEILPDVKLEETASTWRAWVWAKDTAINLTIPGFNETPKMQNVCVARDRSGKCLEYESKPNPFASTIAMSKATRNALRHLIPEKEIIALYNAWSAKRKGSA